MHKLRTILKRALTSVLAPAISLMIFAGAAFAQVPSAQPPYNIDLGATAPTIKNTAQVPATVNSAQLNNLDKNGAICTYYATAQSGSPNVTLNIQNYDSASGQYYTVASGVGSGTVTATFTVMTRAGLQTSSLQSGITAQGVPLARYWRVQEIISGANTTQTGGVGCVNIK